MNINSVYNILNNSSSLRETSDINNAIDYLLKEIKNIANELDYSKYNKLVDQATNISNTTNNYIYNFNDNSIINEGIYKIYGLLAIYLKIRNILNSNINLDGSSSFDIISKIDEHIESDLENFEHFLNKPSFINNELREVDDASEKKDNQVYMFNKNVSERDALVFDDRTITNEESDPEDPGFMMFQQKKLYDIMTDYINNETVFNQTEQLTIFNFQYLLNTYFNQFVKKYIEKHPNLEGKLKFLYKGGTTMGILFQNIMNYLEINLNQVMKNILKEVILITHYNYKLI